MTSMALAATLFGPEDLRMVERPLDPLASGMVRIRFGAGGICGSDMHYYRHARTGDFVVTSPLVLGHEIAGEVVEIAGAAPSLKIGDRVAVNPSRWCGHCKPCRESRQNLCENIFFMGSASKTPHMQGGFASQFDAIPAQCVKIPDHVSYQAAALAWEAAKLLPDNDDLTAYILWQGGSFIKNRDQQYADVFYKALVRRNGQTVLGAEADRQRWFPIIDNNGNIVPANSRVELPAEQPETQPMEEPNGNESSEELDAKNLPASPGQSESVKGYEYVVQKGDSLASIAQEFAKAGVIVSREELLAANPGLDPARLRVGQRMFVPANPD